MRLVHDSGIAAVPEPQEQLLRLLKKARSWWIQMLEGDLTASQLAAQQGVVKTYVSRVIRLNFLSPKIIESILTGQHPANLDAKRLLAMTDLPLAWSRTGKRKRRVGAASHLWGASARPTKTKRVPGKRPAEKTAAKASVDLVLPFSEVPNRPPNRAELRAFEACLAENVELSD